MDTMGIKINTIETVGKEELKNITNVIAITSEHDSLFEHETLLQLEQHINQFADILRFCPLRGLKRIVIIFDEMDEESGILGWFANDIKKRLHQTQFLNCFLKVYLLEPIHHTQLNKDYLKVIPGEKLFLLSPPNSPPSGWKSIVEDPPNTKVFSEDLISRLNLLDINHNNTETNNQPLEIFFDDGLPKVLVQDVSNSNVASSNCFVKTAMPSFH